MKKSTKNMSRWLSFIILFSCNFQSPPPPLWPGSGQEEVATAFSAESSSHSSWPPFTAWTSGSEGKSTPNRWWRRGGDLEPSTNDTGPSMTGPHLYNIPAASFSLFISLQAHAHTHTNTPAPPHIWRSGQQAASQHEFPNGRWENWPPFWPGLENKAWHGSW